MHLLVADQLNTYDVLCSDDVVFTSGALEAFLAGPAPGQGREGRGDLPQAEAAIDTEEAGR